MDGSLQDTDVFAALTPAQREAVAHIDGPLLILAGPGSGKTRVVTHRVANLLRHEIPPWQVLALTFTNKAADEMRQRVERLTGSRRVWMGTFHAFCARLLRQHGPLVGLREHYSICDTEDSLRVLKLAIDDSGVLLTHTSPEALARAISWAKNNLLGPEDYVPRSDHAIGTLVERVYPCYQRRLLAANAVDFDDLLLHVALLLRQQPELRSSLDQRYRYILVDEYQDTNLAQYAIVRALSVDCPNLAVTGDPDQSIYGWRGANVRNILDFEHDYPQVKVVRLEQNFRSTPNILRVADHLIAYNVRRKPKRLYTDQPEGRPVRLVVYPTEQEEAQGIAQRIADELASGRRRAADFAIFYRTNALSRQFEHALRARRIPYQVVSGLEFYQRREIKDVLAYLHLVHNPQNDIAFRRIINTPPRGIGAKTLERLEQHARRHRLSLLEAARECRLVESITKRTAAQLTGFVAWYDALAARGGNSVWELMDAVLDRSGYRRWLTESGTEEDEDRLANVDELLTAAAEFDRQQAEEDNRLERFLEQASLVSDTDALEEQCERVTLMTLHAAKGLEFPAVFIVAVEEGLLPHEHSREAADKLEEERRLLFVGITRARQELQLSLANYRAFRGERRPTVPSNFLMELPREELERSEPAEFAAAEETYFAADRDEAPHAEEAAHPVWSDEDFVQDAPAPRYAGRRRDRSGKTTEAGDDADVAARFPAAAWTPGGYVTHPELGTGVIVTASGTGKKRTVRVQFHDSGDIHTYVVAHSPLEPWVPDYGD